MWFSSYFFFFKQKTAYEMRISDWSSDVCSSDLKQVLLAAQEGRLAKGERAALLDKRAGGADAQLLVRSSKIAVLPEQLQAGADVGGKGCGRADGTVLALHHSDQIGRAHV